MRCQLDHLKTKRNVPCERDRDEICNFTNFYIRDDENGMLVPPIVNMIAKFWLEITQISRRDERARGEGKEMKAILVPSLEKIDIWMNNQNWEIIDMDRKECFNLIKLFHIFYMGSLI